MCKIVCVFDKCRMKMVWLATSNVGGNRSGSGNCSVLLIIFSYIFLSCCCRCCCFCFCFEFITNTLSWSFGGRRVYPIFNNTFKCWTHLTYCCPLNVNVNSEIDVRLTALEILMILVEKWETNFSADLNSCENRIKFLWRAFLFFSALHICQVTLNQSEKNYFCFCSKQQS